MESYFVFFLASTILTAGAVAAPTNGATSAGLALAGFYGVIALILKGIS